MLNLENMTEEALKKIIVDKYGENFNVDDVMKNEEYARILLTYLTKLKVN